MEETNHDRIAAVFEPLRGQEFTTAQIKQRLRGKVQPGSVLPNDHAARDHLGACQCAGGPN